MISYWPNNTKTGNIIITTSGGTATSSENFTVTPTITGFSPTSGSVGMLVTITGNQLYRGEECDIWSRDFRHSWLRLVTLLGFVAFNHLICVAVSIVGRASNRRGLQSRRCTLSPRTATFPLTANRANRSKIRSSELLDQHRAPPSGSPLRYCGWRKGECWGRAHRSCGPRSS